MDFTQFNLDDRIMAGVRNAGFQNPTAIQEAAIPLALAGHDLIGTAQTGTGKTAAFVLPILQKLIKGPGKKTRALIVTPTRELADQINQTIRSLRGQILLRSIAIYGGVGAGHQIDALHKGVDIIVACPGRLLDHIQNGHAKLDQLQMLVLDEADRMFDMGFLPDIKRIMKHIPAKRQTLLFSATFPKAIEKLAAQTLDRPKRVSIGMVAPAHTVAHTLYPVAQHLKRKMVIKLLKQTDTNSVLIFARTKHRAERLAKQIGQKNYRVTSLHGNRSQGQRRSAINGFKSGKFQIMVATDIAARGLDIELISHVINYDMPDTADAYIHRIGRAGRAERSGEAFTLATPDDGDMIRKIERIMKQKLETKTFPDFDYDVPKPNYPQNNQKPRTRNNRNGNNNGKNHVGNNRNGNRRNGQKSQNRSKQGARNR